MGPAGRNRTVLLLLGVALFAATMLAQMALTARRDSAWTLERMSFLPSGDRVRPFLCGYTTALADYLWIKTTLYFGSHTMTDRQYPYLIHLVDMVTRLNPDFYPAYEFAGLLIPEICHNPDAARVILERGISGGLGRRRWTPAFYCGMLYFQYYHDTKTAAEYIAAAARVPGAPVQKLAGLAALFYSRAGGLAQAHAFLVFMYENAQSPEVRQYLLDKLKKF
jgi:hypothetical protein